MKCDFCGCETDKNYFTDDLTVLCKTCAGAGCFYAGEQAKQYINNKNKGE